MYFCLRGKGCEARSSQTATRLLAVLWFESLLLVWRLYSRTIRPVARFLFAESARAIASVFERNLSKGFLLPLRLALAVHPLRRSALTSY